MAKAEKATQKLGWQFLLVVGILIFVLGSMRLKEALAGQDIGGKHLLTELGPLSTALAKHVRQVTIELALAWWLISVLLIVIVVISYRKGERWAWYVLWSVPALAITVTLSVNAALGDFLFAPGPPAVVILVLSLLGLLLPYRKFFPRT